MPRHVWHAPGVRDGFGSLADTATISPKVRFVPIAEVTGIASRAGSIARQVAFSLLSSAIIGKR
jgi:hypothetical protein